MLIRLVILSAFVLLVHLVVGMFAREHIHELTKRAAKDDGVDATGNAMFRRRQLLSQQHTVKRAATQKTARRSRDSREESLKAEETSYAGALVKEVEGNSSLATNESKTVSDPSSNITSDAKDSSSVDSPTESKEASSTPVTRKRRPVHHATESSSVSSHLPIAAALTMSESLYNHFRPLESEVPEDQFLPFLQFGKKLVPNAKTTFPATVTGSTNALDSVTNSPRTREHSSFHPPTEVLYQTPVTKPRPSEEEVNEDMDVAIVKSVVEKNKATHGKINSLLSIRNVGGLYRKQPETNENLVISSDKSSINDTGAKVNDTKDLERKRLTTVLAGKKNFEVIVDSNGRRKIVAVSRRPLVTNITAPDTSTTTTTTYTIPTTNTSTSNKDEQLVGDASVTSASTTTSSPTTTSSTSTVTQLTSSSTVYPTITSSSSTIAPTTSTSVQPTITSTTVSTSLVPRTNLSSIDLSLSEHESDDLSLSHDPTQFSSSNVVASRTTPQRPVSRNSTGFLTRRRQSSLYNSGRKSYPLRTATFRPSADNKTELDMTPEESNVSSSFTSTTDNSSVTETTAKPTSIIEKYQLMRMAEVRGGRRHLRQNYTDILRANKYSQGAENDTRLINDTQTPNSRVEASTVPTLSRNISGFSVSSVPQIATSEFPPTTISPVPTTKILSTAVVTSVSIKGAWTSGVTEMPPLYSKDSIGSVLDIQDKVISNLTVSQSHNSTDAIQSVHTTAPGNATYSMIKDLLAEMNTSSDKLDAQVVRNVTETESGTDKTDETFKRALPLSHEHFVGVDQPRPVFSNSSIIYTTSYRGHPHPDPSEPFVSENVATNHSFPIGSTTTSTSTTSVPTPYITTASVSTPSSESASFSTEISQSAFLSSSSSRPIIDIPSVNTSVYQQDNSSILVEQNLNKGRALWRNTTSRPSTSIPVIQSSDKDFDLPLVKLYNASTVWSDSIQPTEQMVHAETQYDTIMKVDEDFIDPENRSDHIANGTMGDVGKCTGSQDCSEDMSTSTRPTIFNDCAGKNATRGGCGSRPREDSVAAAETTSSIEMAVYVLAGICVIPAAVGALFLVRCVLRHRRKVLDESDTCSEISCHRAGENGEATTPASTKLPRLQPHMGWDQEKSPAPPPVVPDNSRWEFPRSMLRLQTVLGQGNFGQVLKAEADDLNDHSGTTRLVAVKLVKEGATTREKEDLLRELEIMKQLGAHPNVVTLLGCCTEQEPYLLIMEYVMYGKLLTFLRDHRTRQNYYNFSEDSDALTSRDLTVFGYCVARGMEYLVSKGIIHRDLAARNVLVDHNKLCKIADFGMSRSVRELGEIYEQRQTKGALPIRWMAPESLLYRVFTHKSDVWSFGILMWEIVTLGSTPYPAMGAREVMKKVREGYRLERPSHCRPELFRVISHCWNADPGKRPDFSELKRELGTLVEDARQGKYVDLDRFAEYSGGRTTTLHSGGEPELIHM